MSDSTGLRSMEFGEIFSRGFSLMVKMLPNAGVIIIALQAIFGVIIGLLISNVVAAIGEIVLLAQTQGSNPQLSQHAIWQILTAYLSFIPIVLLLSIAQYFIRAVAINGSWHAIQDEEISIGELMRKAITRDTWMLWAHNFIVGTFVGIGYMVIVLLAVLFGQATPVLAVLVGLAGFGALIYFAIGISLGAHEVVINRRGPFRSLGRSLNLIRGSWWKTFGILAVVSMVTSMLTWIFAIPLIGRIIDLASALPRGSHPDQRIVASLLANFFSNLPIWIVPVLMIASAFTSMILISAQTALHVDLRARNGEFDTIEDDGLRMGA